MTFKTLLRAGIISLVSITVLASGSFAQSVRVMEGITQAPLKVPLNRAVVVESDVVFAELSVANPTIADIATLSERTIYVLGKAPGRTTLTLLGLNGRLITNIEVQVTPDIAEIKERISELLPGEDIQVRTANDGIVLSGTVSSAARVTRAMDVALRYAPEAVLNLMVVGGTQQVLLKVRFAEMSRTVSKEISSALNITDINAGNGAVNLTSPALAPVGAGGGALGVSVGAGSFQFAATLNALEGKGLVRTIAEPNLTALSGKSASFLAGGEYPIAVEDDDGNQTTDYRPFGVELGFVPTVVDQDIINLEINASVSSISDEATPTGDPVFNNRRTATTVELRDGQSFALAGLLEENFTDAVSQLPWIGDVPVLGALFRSASFRREQSELIILITAHLVEPTSGEALALPTDRVRPPTESELFLFGRVAGPNNGGAVSTGSRDASEVEAQDFTGSYGYVLE